MDNYPKIIPVAPSYLEHCYFIYCTGWQARWFILDNGILSYYKSEEDVVTGCKGSVKISACDIVGR